MSCPLCGDLHGWNRVIDSAGVSRLKRCECWARDHRYADGLPQEFRSAILDDWSNTYRHAMKAAADFLQSAVSGIPGDRDLYLCGSVGTGKTRLACAVLNAYHAIKRDGKFRRVPWVLIKLQPSGGSDVDLLRPLLSAPLLVLDDLGAERETATDYTRRTLLAIAEQRRDVGFRTIWTSNLSPAQVGDHMGDDRLMSRLVGWCDVVGMQGADRRLAG